MSQPRRFTKEQRLLVAADFSRVFDNPTRSYDQFFTILCRSRPAGPARLGLAISKKHCRLAVRRNRLKRIIRESFRQHQHIIKGLDIVVINKPAAANAINQRLFDSLEKHWQRCARASET